MNEKLWMEIPVGWAGFELEDGFVTKLRMSRQKPIEANFQEKPSEAARRVAEELREYFEGSRKEFDIPIMLKGTEFQKSVWEAMRKIPYGEVRSYGDIAFAAGRPFAARAVGGACNRNPIWIMVPCHRVIGADRSLVGYGGSLDVKRFLLKMEGAKFKE